MTTPEPYTPVWYKAHRARLQITQTQLAVALDVDHETIRNWETGRSFPNEANRAKLDQLFTEKENES